MHHIAQYAGQKGITQHDIPDKKELLSTVYRTKRHYTAQYTGQKRLYSIIYWPNSLHGTIYQTKGHCSARYTGQEGITQHGIPDKKALHSTIYWTKNAYTA